LCGKIQQIKRGMIINMKKYFFYLFIGLISLGNLCAQERAGSSFQVVPLGIKGGLDESNLSSYLVAPAGSRDFICADAGTVRHGIDIAIQNKVFRGSADEVLKNQVKGYLISHPHLDHVAGLLMNSPEDSPKNIYAIPSVVDVLKDKYFTWKAWANFTNEGELPHLNKYTYVYLQQHTKQQLANTQMEVTPFILSHGSSYQSTAFLIGHKDTYLLYLGDTGADSIEKSTYLAQLWNKIAPLVRNNQLKAILIEVSFPDEQPEKQLFGHLTPKLLMNELEQLNQLTNLEALRKVPIVITHMKAFGKQEITLKNELKQRNQLGLKLVFPKQGKMMNF